MLRERTAIAERAATLNTRYRDHTTAEVLEAVLTAPGVGRVAVVSSFGAESVALLHLVSEIAPATPVLFIDTDLLFPETLAYQSELATRLGLTDLRTVRAGAPEVESEDRDATLHRRDPDACCALRKTRPLERALNGFDAWITGRKRYQSSSRATLELFEIDGAERLKINPLALWSSADVQDYIVNHRLPQHPLVARGYPSIGCAPCTRPVEHGEAPRAGRWCGREKEECGIHIVDGRIARGRSAGERGRGERVIVTDSGFSPDDWDEAVVSLESLAEGANPRAIDVPSDANPDTLTPLIGQVALIRIAFAKFSDGRGFAIARRLRCMGYTGRLRAAGDVIADQYAMARRSGFDEVEIDTALAARQPEDQWRLRADWHAHDYQSRLRG